MINKVAVYLSKHPDIKPTQRPKFIDIEERHRLYENQFYKDNGTYKSKLFPFLRVSFSSQRAINSFSYILNNPQDIPGLDRIHLRCHASAKNLTPVMKLLAIKNLPSSNWLFARGLVPHRRESNKTHEYIIGYNNIIPHPNSDNMPIVHPLICSFDLETYSSEHGRFPDPENPNDILLQIGCTLARKGKVIKKTVLTLGTPKVPSEEEKAADPEGGHDFEIKTFDCEAKLLLGFSDYIKQYDIDVLIGYNIFGFDIRYLVARANMLRQWDDFSKFGCIDKIPAEFLSMKWESSARGVVDLQFLNAHGRLFIDLLPVIRASENLESYKLEFVAAKHLKTNKDPIKPQDIFNSWKNKDWDMFYKVTKYCCQDTLVTYLLFEKLLIWFGLVESATTNKVPIFCMVSQGQQIKAFSQVFDFCYNNNIICNPPPKKMKKPYKGAIVTEPIAGLYKMILPFDFASLYPSIMIAHNIDFSRFVTDPSIPDEACYCFNWEDHEGCSHDTNVKETKQRFKKDGTPIVAKKKKVICGEYHYRFLKQDAGGKGVVPTIIENLLAARKKVRKIISANEDKIHLLEEEIDSGKCTKVNELKAEINRLKEVNAVLDKRQLAYKVNANSMYGMYGAENGYLPFFPGAETVTYVGRTSIIKASERIEKVHGGKVIYNDTDSAYCYFDSMKDKSVQEIWEFAEGVVKDIETLFVKPMKLEFEGKIYVKFMIFTKKKYVAQPVDEHGKLKDKLYMRGVPLVRREYCANMKYIYEKCVKYILNNIDELTSIPKEQLKSTQLFKDFLDMIFENFLNALQWKIPLKDFVIYKGLTKETYATPQEHSAVADKMRARGTPVAVNSRLEYILLAEPDGAYLKNKKKYEITEDLGYFKEFRDILRLDYLKYFVSQYVNYLDQMTVTIFGVENAIERMVEGIGRNELRDLMKNGTTPFQRLGYGLGGSFVERNHLLMDIKDRFKCKIEFENNVSLVMHHSAPITCTANKVVEFNNVYRRKKLFEWVDIVLQGMEWTYEKGTLMYDQIATGLDFMFMKGKPKDTVQNPRLVYEGMRLAYNFWRDNKPYATDSRYKEVDMSKEEGIYNSNDYDKAPESVRSVCERIMKIALKL